MYIHFDGHAGGAGRENTGVPKSVVLKHLNTRKLFFISSSMFCMDNKVIDETIRKTRNVVCPKRILDAAVVLALISVINKS